MASVYDRLGQTQPKAPEAPAKESGEEPAAVEATATAKAKEETDAQDAQDADTEAKGGGKPPEAEEREIEVTQEQLEYIQQEVTAKTKDLNEQLTAAQAKVADLEAKVSASGQPGPVLPRQLHPLLVADDNQAIREHQAKLENAKTWALEHWDGTEASADGKTPAYSKEEVRQLYANCERELKVIPLAQQNFAARQQWDTPAKQAYPELFNAQSADHKAMQAFLQVCPQIKLFPSFKVLIGDALRGERIRLAEAKAGAASSGAAGPAAASRGAPKPTTAVKVKLAPKAPVGAKPGPAAAGTRQAKAKGVPDVGRFVKSGANRESLVATVAAML